MLIDLKMELRALQELDFLFELDDFWKMIREMINNAIDAVRDEPNKLIFFLSEKRVVMW